MKKISKSADSLIAEVRMAVREDILTSVVPIVERMAAATLELQNALSRDGAAPRRRGRPPKNAAAAGAGTPRPQKRSPRGALRTEVEAALTKAGTPLKLSEIRERVLKTRTFKGRDPKTLYTMIVFAVNKMPEIRKNADGRYGLHGADAGKAARKQSRRKAPAKAG